MTGAHCEDDQAETTIYHGYRNWVLDPSFSSCNVLLHLYYLKKGQLQNRGQNAHYDIDNNCIFQLYF